MRDYILTSSKTREAKRRLEKIDKQSLNNFISKRKEIPKGATVTTATMSTTLGTAAYNCVKHFAEQLDNDHSTDGGTNKNNIDTFVRAIQIQAKSKGTKTSGLFYKHIYMPLKDLKTKKWTTSQAPDDQATNKFYPDETIASERNEAIKWLEEIEKHIKTFIDTRKDPDDPNAKERRAIVAKLRSKRYSNVLKVFMALALYEFIQTRLGELKQSQTNASDHDAQLTHNPHPHVPSGQENDSEVKVATNPDDSHPSEPPTVPVHHAAPAEHVGTPKKEAPTLGVAQPQKLEAAQGEQPEPPVEQPKPLTELEVNALAKNINLGTSKFMFFTHTKFPFDAQHGPRMIKAAEDLYCIYPSVTGYTNELDVGELLYELNKQIRNSGSAQKKLYSDWAKNEQEMLDTVINYRSKGPNSAVLSWAQFLDRRYIPDDRYYDTRTNRDIMQLYINSLHPAKQTASGQLLRGPGPATESLHPDDLDRTVGEKHVFLPQQFGKQGKDGEYEGKQTIKGVEVDTINFATKMKKQIFKDLYQGDDKTREYIINVVETNTSAPTLERGVRIDGLESKKYAGRIGNSEEIIQTDHDSYKISDGRVPGQDTISIYEKVYPRPKGYKLYQIIQAASQTNGLESVHNEYTNLTGQSGDPTQGPTVCSISTMAWMRRDIMYRQGKLPDSAADLLDTLIEQTVIEPAEDEGGAGYKPCKAYYASNVRPPHDFFYRCGYIQPWTLNEQGQQILCEAVQKHPCGYMSQAAVTDEPIVNKGSNQGCSFKYVFAAAMSYQPSRKWRNGKWDTLAVESQKDHPNPLAQKLNYSWIYAQYENIIKDAIRTSAALPEKTVVLVHLANVGQGAFGNPKGLPETALNEAFEKHKAQLEGSNIRIIKHWR